MRIYVFVAVSAFSLIYAHARGFQISSAECTKVIKHKQQTRPRPKVNLTEQRDFPALPVTTPTPPQIQLFLPFLPHELYLPTKILTQDT